jgi:restriction system protein
MARRSRSTLEALTRLPWPVGIVIGLIMFTVLGFVIPTQLESTRLGGQQLALQGSSLRPLTMLSWLALALCWMAAGVAWLGARRRRRLLDQQRNLDSLTALDWRDFERLVGEAYRRAGWAVEETGLGGKDGGIDLILRRDGRTILVQCKQWRRRKIPVTVVRELWGLAHHHRADGVILACIGTYTADASAFAAGKPIELVNGDALLTMIRGVQTIPRPSKHSIEPRLAVATSTAHARAQVPRPTPATENQASALPCPICAAPMVQRLNWRAGEAFHGCSAYPKCRGSRPVRAPIVDSAQPKNKEIAPTHP